MTADLARHLRKFDPTLKANEWIVGNVGWFTPEMFTPEMDIPEIGQEVAIECEERNQTRVITSFYVHRPRSE